MRELISIVFVLFRLLDHDLGLHVDPVLSLQLLEVFLRVLQLLSEVHLVLVRHL
jgi:hypothetical protein